MDHLHHAVLRKGVDSVTRRQEGIETLDKDRMAAKQLRHPFNHSRCVNPVQLWLEFVPNHSSGREDRRLSLEVLHDLVTGPFHQPTPPRMLFPNAHIQELVINIWLLGELRLDIVQIRQCARSSR